MSRRVMRVVVLFYAVSLVAPSFAQAAVPRVARVVGNNADKQTSPLLNCTTDPGAIREPLVALGFTARARGARRPGTPGRYAAGGGGGFRPTRARESRQPTKPGEHLLE